VNSEAVLDSLLERRLIRITGRKEAPGRPYLFETTREFLVAFGLRDIGDLPKVEGELVIPELAAVAEHGEAETQQDPGAGGADLSTGAGPHSTARPPRPDPRYDRVGRPPSPARRGQALPAPKQAARVRHDPPRPAGTPGRRRPRGARCAPLSGGPPRLGRRGGAPAHQRRAPHAPAPSPAVRAPACLRGARGGERDRRRPPALGRA